MPTILEEIEADQNPRSACKLCAWIASKSPAEQAQWDKACATKAYTQTSIYRALRRHDLVIGKGTVEGHINNKHRQSA